MKPKFIISTTGTSIGTNVRRDIFSKPISKGNMKDVEIEIQSGIEGKDINSISAETKSLNKIGVDTSTSIVFICTDTPDGKLCAEILKEWCIKNWSCTVFLRGIKGLQVKDANLFAREGLKNYLKTCINLIEKNESSHNVILNPTGGFKGIVPYTTLLGMLFSMPIYYIFEMSDALIKLPYIPINYDETLMDMCAEKLKRIEDETFIGKSYFWEGIDFYQRERFASLIEEEGNNVTLSPIGLLLWERYKKDFPLHLKRTTIKPQDKKIHLRDDHGKDVLMHWSKRLVNSPYVEEIINSIPFNPRTTEPIRTTTDDGLLELVLTKTDAGYGMVVKTTGKNKRETEEIARILKERYGF